MIDAPGAVLFLWCLSPCHAQIEKSPEVVTRDATATFNSKVSLVTVPVVVRDQEGHAIGTLKKEDFQLFDKGKPQLISKFTIEKADRRTASPEMAPAEPAIEKAADKTPATASRANRFTAYLFDDRHINTADLMAAREAAIKYLNESSLSTDRAAIYTTSGQIMLDFTDDKVKLKETINRIAPKSRLVKLAKPCPDISEYMADQIVEKYPGAYMVHVKDVENPLVLAVAEVLACMPKIKQEEAISIAQSAAREVYNTADADSQVSLLVLSDLLKRVSAMPGQRTVVLASSGFLTMSHQEMEQELIDRAIRSNVIVNTLDARGLFTATPFGDASTAASNTTTANVNEKLQAKAARAQSEILAELADATGGTYFHNNNDLQEGFRRAGAAPQFTYVLGFTPQSLKSDGSFHQLKVSLKDIKSVTVSARRGYYAPRHGADAAADAMEEIKAAVFSRDEISDIPLEMHTQFFKVTNQTAELTVSAHIDLKSLHFKKSDGRTRDTLNSVLAVFDRNGILVSAVQKEINLQFKEETFAARIANGAVVKSDFNLPPGSYIVRVVVRDSEGQNMAARNSMVEIP